MNRAQPVIRVYRGEEIEAEHCASVAVVDGRGLLTHALGDPDMVTMMRSCIKPFQLLPLIVTGAADHFGFAPRHLAIMAGSHNGTDEHCDVVRANLAAAGNEPTHLQCGSHWPLGMKAQERYPINDEDRDPIRHNCSGKHSGFLALARYLNESPEGYIDPDSKLQTMVKQTVSGYTEYPLERMPTGIDGCSAPNFPLSLRHVALAFMKLAAGRAADEDTRQAVGRIRDAMMAHPEMVSGERRLDLALARSFPGRIVSKIGAESVEGIGLTDPPIGIAVKIHDGGERALGPVVVEVLRQLGILRSIEEAPPLEPYERPEVRNNRDLVTGRIIPEFELRRM